MRPIIDQPREQYELLAAIGVVAMPALVSVGFARAPATPQKDAGPSQNNGDSSNVEPRHSGVPV
jgi:hypothetical protein